jgi:hypothetical protein
LDQLNRDEEEMTMNPKMLCNGASGDDRRRAAGGRSGESSLDDPGTMAPFYTDADMQTLKRPADFNAAWIAMKDEDRAGMMKECSDEATAAAHDDFCNMTNQLGGAN